MLLEIQGKMDVYTFTLVLKEEIWIDQTSNCVTEHESMKLTVCLSI